LRGLPYYPRENSALQLSVPFAQFTLLYLTCAFVRVSSRCAPGAFCVCRGVVPAAHPFARGGRTGAGVDPACCPSFPGWAPLGNGVFVAACCFAQRMAFFPLSPLLVDRGRLVWTLGFPCTFPPFPGARAETRCRLHSALPPLLAAFLRWFVPNMPSLLSFSNEPFPSSTCRFRACGCAYTPRCVLPACAVAARFRTPRRCAAGFSSPYAAARGSSMYAPLTCLRCCGVRVLRQKKRRAVRGISPCCTRGWFGAGSCFAALLLWRLARLALEHSQPAFRNAYSVLYLSPGFVARVVVGLFSGV